jgi:hypothetical protein
MEPKSVDSNIYLQNWLLYHKYFFHGNSLLCTGNKRNQNVLSNDLVLSSSQRMLIRLIKYSHEMKREVIVPKIGTWSRRKFEHSKTFFMHKKGQKTSLVGCKAVDLCITRFQYRNYSEVPRLQLIPWINNIIPYFYSSLYSCRHTSTSTRTGR